MSLTAAQRILIKRAIDNKARDKAATRGAQDASKVGRSRSVVKVRHLPGDLLVPIASTQANNTGRVCKGCSGDLDEYTTGCNACRNRHTYRRIRARNRDVISSETEPNP